MNLSQISPRPQSEKKMPLISVIMPVYNAAGTLRKAVDSVMHQTFDDYELILVDDGSKDDSPVMCDNFAVFYPDKIRVMHKENGGLMRAWIDGLKLSRGQFLCFVDSDDWIDPDMLEKMSSRLERDGDGRALPGQIVCCGYLIEYSSNPPKKEINGIPEGVYEGEKLEKELKKELLGHETRRMIFSRCMKLISAELFTENLRYLNPDIRQGEDCNITVPAILDASRVVVTNDPLYHYAYMEDSMVHKYDKNFFSDCQKLRDKLLIVAKDKPLITETMVNREFLFLFLQTVKREIRRQDPPNALKKAITQTRALCVSENSRKLLALYPEKMRDASYRLTAFVCRHPSVIRILCVRLIYGLYDMSRGLRKNKSPATPRVLMAGPARDVTGGVSAVVNSYYACGIDRQISLIYLPTMKDGGKIKKALVFAGAYLRFGSLMKRADILHVHLSPRASYARKAILIKRARRMGKRIVLHQHGGDFERFYEQECDAAKQAEIRRVFAMADIVIVLSEEWRDFFANGICDPARIVVLHNGVVLPDRNKTGYGDHNVLMLGKLREQKGIYDLLSAVPEVTAKVPDAQFLLCGDGDMDECRRKVQELGCSEHVRMPGWIGEKERAEAFASCSTFILPSHFEGMPMSLLEAMGHGLACVATDVGGIPQVIKSGENGILIKPGNPDEIASALITLLNDEPMRKRLGEAAAETVRRDFDARGNVDTILSLYRSLLA